MVYCCSLRCNDATSFTSTKFTKLCSGSDINSVCSMMDSLSGIAIFTMLIPVVLLEIGSILSVAYLFYVTDARFRRTAAFWIKFNIMLYW